VRMVWAGVSAVRIWCADKESTGRAYPAYLGQSPPGSIHQNRIAARRHAVGR